MARPSNTAERRRQISEALLRVMAKKGYEGATIADVAREAGLTPGLVHYHFANKLEILFDLVERLRSRQESALAAAIEPLSADPAAALEAFIDHHLAAGENADPEALACWIALSGEALREPKIKKRYEKTIRGSAGVLAEILARGRARRIFEIDDVDAATAALVALVQGYYVLAATSRELIPRGSAAAAAKAMATGLLYGRTGGKERGR